MIAVDHINCGMNPPGQQGATLHNGTRGKAGCQGWPCPFWRKKTAYRAGGSQKAGRTGRTNCRLDFFAGLCYNEAGRGKAPDRP